LGGIVPEEIVGSTVGAFLNAETGSGGVIGIVSVEAGCQASFGDEIISVAIGGTVSKALVC